MNKDIFYVGIDVGSLELWASIEGSKPKMFSHSKKGIKSLYDWSVKKSNQTQIQFCMEATGVYSMSVANLLVEKHQAQLSIVNPAQIKTFAAMQMRRSKTDQIDAQIIRNFAETQSPRLWQPVSKQLQQLTAMVTQADAIKESLGQWHNRHHAQGFIPDLPKDVKKTQRAIERSLETQLKKIETAIKNLVASESVLSHKVALLCTIPGVADQTAVKLLAYGQNWLTDRSAKALTAYAGLAPQHHQSGTSVNRKARIDKRGNPKLRKTLYMPALVAVHYNPDLKIFYQRLLKNGKPKKLALVAAMRKLLILSRAILITQKPFIPQI